MEVSCAMRRFSRSPGEARRPPDAEAPLRRAFALQPTAPVAKTLGMLALDRRDLLDGATYLQRSLALDPMQPPVLYQLSLTYGLLHDLPNARRMAIRLAQLDPSYPGLAGWMATLGLSR
jgi:Flp pilus assembly protein TadD